MLKFKFKERHFTQKDISYSTKLEHWNRSEINAYNIRIDKFVDVKESYSSAKLGLRVLVRSKVYEEFLPFDHLIGESLNHVPADLKLIHDEKYVASSESLLNYLHCNNIPCHYDRKLCH